METKSIMRNLKTSLPKCIYICYAKRCFYLLNFINKTDFDDMYNMSEIWAYIHKTPVKNVMVLIQHQLKDAFYFRLQAINGYLM